MYLVITHPPYDYYLAFFNDEKTALAYVNEKIKESCTPENLKYYIAEFSNEWEKGKNLKFVHSYASVCIEEDETYISLQVINDGDEIEF